MSKTIKLFGTYSNNQSMVVDDEDYEELNKYKWIINKKGYIYTQMLVHRKIMNINNTETELVVDHKNRDKLDNRKENLRICTQQENNRNKSKYKKNNTIYKGVQKRNNNSYEASLYSEGKTIYLGRFTTEMEAAHAYDKKAIELFGEFACLNFPNFDYNDYQVTKKHGLYFRGSSKYRGIYWSKSKKKWTVELSINYKKIYIGTFTDEIEAAKHRDYYHIKLRNNYKYLNFPEIDYSTFVPTQ